MISSRVPPIASVCQRWYHIPKPLIPQIDPNYPSLSSLAVWAEFHIPNTWFINYIVGHRGTSRPQP